MSSLSNLPYGQILDYWYERLSGHESRNRFILTKILEILIFKAHGSRSRNRGSFTDFPAAKQNNVPVEPVVTIVIPAYINTNFDRNNLANLISSIKTQTRRPNNVVIVNDCSPLNIVADHFIEIHSLSKNSGPAAARNKGKEIALKLKSDIIAFADADCILSENWVQSIIDSFQRNKDFQILAGNTISHDTHWYGNYHNLNGTLNGRVLKNTDRLLYGTTANMAITRDVAEEVNFNEKFPIAAGEDIEFCFIANKKGFAIKHESAMTVKHNYGYSGNYFANVRRFRNLFKKYGQGERILLEVIPEYYAYFDRTVEIPAEL